MTNKKIFLHVGLQKTGSTFLQQKVFTNLDKQKICYNPKNIINLLEEYPKILNYNQMNELRKKINLEMEEILQQSILMSSESFVGEIFKSYNDLDKRIDFFNYLFPNVKIIIFFRNQIEWLISLYKQAVHTGYSMSIDEFLNFNGKEFVNSNEKNYPNVSALDFDFKKIISIFEEKLNNEDIHFMFQEELNYDLDDTVKRLEDILDCKIIGQIQKTRENRGYSALAIKMTQIKSKFFPKINNEIKIRKLTNIYNKLKIEYENASVNKSRKIKMKLILGCKLLSKLRYLDYIFVWRIYMQYGVDRVHYFDWDLLGNNKRTILSEHYSKLNKSLIPYFQNKKLIAIYCKTSIINDKEL